jgi:hypothetical protein
LDTIEYLKHFALKSWNIKLDFNEVILILDSEKIIDAKVVFFVKKTTFEK